MEKNGQVIRSVQRALDMLLVFGEGKQELTLTEIADKTGLVKSTTSRILLTLEKNGFIEKDSSNGKYRLGIQLYTLGHIAGRSIDLKNVSKDVMIKLRDQVGETINLYVLDGYDRVCIQQYESLQSVRHMVQIGQRLPLTVGASGKVLLAYQEEALIDEVINNQRMVKSKDSLKNELVNIIKNCYGESIEEREAGTSAAAAPVFDIKGEMVAALSISGPAQRFVPNERPDVKKQLIESANKLSENLGFTT